MSSAEPVIGQRFENRVAQAALAAFSALAALLGFAMLAEASSRVSGASFLLFGALFTVRALRSSSVVVNDSGVTTLSIVRTRHYAFSELRRVDVAVGRTGLAGFGREHLVIHCADGRVVAFKELNCPSSQDGSMSVVRRAASCINGWLHRG